MFISSVFKADQFDSPDVPGSGVNMQQVFIDLLTAYFSQLGFSPAIKSGYRTEYQNNIVRGASNSAHKRGYAVDLHALDINQRNQMVAVAVTAGFRRIGIYPTFIHLDNDPTLPTPAYWGKDFSKTSAPFNPFVGRNIVPTPLNQRAQPPIIGQAKDFIDVDEDSTAQQICDKYKLTISAQELVDLNKDNIYLKYNGIDRKKYQQASVELIKGQTKLLIPLAKIKRQALVPANSFVYQNISYAAYLSTFVANLINNNLYKRAEITNVDNGTFIQSNKPSVYIWCKALGDNGQLIDVSSFVNSIQHHVGKNGGNFSIDLTPIICDWNSKTGWQIQRGNITSYLNTNNEEEYVGVGSTHEQRRIDSQDIRSNFTYTRKYFHTILSSNDIVFIRGERLEAESGIFVAESSSIEIDVNQLPGKIYDMIGLIDVNPLQSNIALASESILVSGRDISKALIEDNVQYFPNEFAGVSRIGYFRDQKEKDIALIRRFEGDGSIIPDGLFNAFYARTIAQTITFIISRLANIQICPDAVFSAWTEKTKFTYPLVLGGTKDIIAKGIWQIVSLFVQGTDPNATDNDKLVANRLIADSSISTDSGSLLNFVNKVCQPPWIQFMMDTIGDRFVMTARRSPFTYVDYKSNFTIELQPDEIIDIDLSFSEKEIYSWYRLTPQANYFGDSNYSATAYLKAVLLPEYMEIWGSKAFDVVSNYMTTQTFDQDEEQVKIFDEYFKKQNIQDLEFCMEAYAYMPFVRSGTITLKPNRLIKRGMNIYLPTTGELCYVDGVTGNWNISIDQTTGNTILTVERCMVREHLEKYFKLIYLSKYAAPGSNESQVWTVNKEFFNFFIKRQQFVGLDEK